MWSASFPFCMESKETYRPSTPDISRLWRMMKPIPILDWRDPERRRIVDTYGYLIEAQTLPGTSGGPVFVRRHVDMKAAHGKLETWSYGSLWLLGLWQGSWYGAPERYLNLPRGEEIIVPMGTGVVVPAIKIIQTLEQKALVRAREAKRQC